MTQEKKQYRKQSKRFIWTKNIKQNNKPSATARKNKKEMTNRQHQEEWDTITDPTDTKR